MCAGLVAGAARGDDLVTQSHDERSGRGSLWLSEDLAACTSPGLATCRVKGRCVDGMGEPAAVGVREGACVRACVREAALQVKLKRTEAGSASSRAKGGVGLAGGGVCECPGNPGS